MAVPKHLTIQFFPTFPRVEDTLWDVPLTSKKADFARISFYAGSLPQANRGHAKPKNAAVENAK